MALGQRTRQGLHYVCRCKLLPAWQQPAAHHLILRKSEDGKAEKNTFPALLLLLSNSVCHGLMVSKCLTVAGQGPCHQGTWQQWLLTPLLCWIDRDSQSLQNARIIQSDVSHPHYFHPVNPYPLSAVVENPWKSGVGCYLQDNPFSLLLSPLVQGHCRGSCRQAELSPPLPSIFLTTSSFCIAKTSAHDLTATKVKNLKVKYNTEREIPSADPLSLTPSHPAFSRKDKMQKR